MGISGDPRKRTDPRRLGGAIAGPGGPHDRGGVLMDPTNAVLLDYAEVAVIDPIRGGQREPEGFALQLSGRINKTTDRAQVLYLMDEDGAAALITELFACASRHSQELYDRTLGRVQERLEQLVADGNMGHREEP